MKLLVIRGDLQSHSGYATAARDFCRVLEGLFDRLIGVDLGLASERPPEPFPYPLVSETRAQQLAAEADFAVVLSFTTPDHYRRYEAAENVGLTFWETDHLPPACAERPLWSSFANQMDALWAPTTHTKEMFEACGVTVPVRVIPWPVVTPPPGGACLPDGEIYDLDRAPWFAEPLVKLAQRGSDPYARPGRLARNAASVAACRILSKLRSSTRAIPEPQKHALLCVAQDVPRKGLPLLLSEWMEFKRQAEARPWSLILKTGSFHPEVPRFDLVGHFWEHVQALKRQLRVMRAHVFLWAGDLGHEDFQSLLGNTAGMITASLGEGFCGPAAHALAIGKPLISSRHTGLADYLIEDYPYSYATRPASIGFIRDPLKIYHPASTWHVAEPYALAGALTRLAIDTPERRSLACARAHSHFSSYCNPERVRQLLARELERLQRRNVCAAA